MKLKDVSVGLVIDQSMGGVGILNKRIIDLAVENGFKVDFGWPVKNDGVEYFSEEFCEMADEAVDWLNGMHCDPENYFFIDDNSLFFGNQE